MTADPYTATDGLANPQSWNRYSYVENDPVNFTDRRGLFRSAVGKSGDEEDEEGWDPGLVYALLLQVAQSSKVRYGPVQGDVARMSQFSIDMRSAAHQSIANMSAGCKDALGKLWNLSNGLSSLLGKTDPANPNAVKFYDARDSDVASTLMSAWGGSPYVTAQEYLKDKIAFTSNYQGHPSNEIVLGQNYFQLIGADASRTLLHEVLHSYTGKGDVDLAEKMGIGSFASEGTASVGIHKYLELDCDMKKYNNWAGR